MKCKKCGKCCKSTDFEKRIVIIYPSDLLHISKKLNISKRKFIQEYCIKDSIQCDGYVINMYVLKSNENKCIFLTADNLCKIFDDRPLQCREAPYNYFAYENVWAHMPCLDENEIINSDSSENDKKLVQELLKGYNI